MTTPYTTVNGCRLSWARQTLRLDAIPHEEGNHYRVLLANPVTGAAVQWWHTCQGNPYPADIMACIGYRVAVAADMHRFTAAHSELRPDVLRRLLAHEQRIARQLEDVTQ